MSVVRDIALLFSRSATHQLRRPAWIFVGFTTPLLYLVLFTPLLRHYTHGNVLDGFLPGILALLAFASGSGLGFGTIFELRGGVIERLRVTPASRVAILIAPILAAMLMMFVFDAVLVAVAVAFGFHLHWAGLAVLVVLLALMMAATAAFSVTIALITKEISSFAAIVNGLNLPLLLLAGVLLPISVGPEWLRVLGHFNPLYYLVAASRPLAANHLSDGTLWQAFAVLVPLCVITLTWGTRVFRKAVA